MAIGANAAVRAENSAGRRVVDYAVAIVVDAITRLCRSHAVARDARASLSTICCTNPGAGRRVAATAGGEADVRIRIGRTDLTRGAACYGTAQRRRNAIACRRAAILCRASAIDADLILGAIRVGGARLIVASDHHGICTRRKGYNREERREREQGFEQRRAEVFHEKRAFR